MKRKPTKLEEAQFKINLDIDGNKGEAVDISINTIKQMVQFIIGQEDVEKHEVTLEVKMLIKIPTKEKVNE